MRPTECSEGQAGGGGDPVVRNRDVNTRAVFRFGFWLAVGVAAVTLAKKDRASDTLLSPIVAANLARTPPEPRLEPFPLAPGLRLRAEEDAILTTYGWVDKKAGVARIPIDRAMEILAERGLPPSKPMPPAVAPMPTPGVPPAVPGEQSR
ncbi:MAG TPA: hypothetical protein VER78_05820 [Thermoanaerobaculia bacterium]|nr:hypothetical protein [Thermoanaerobaculia bacterium]